MKKLIIILFLLGLCVNSYSAPPTRTYTYTVGATIDPDEVTTNENNIYTYLQGGVDTYEDGSIVNADLSATAAIAYTKLSLSNTIVSGDINDGTIVDADINSSAEIDLSKLKLSDTATFSGALTFTGNNTFAGTTIADLGTVTTSILTSTDINGGTMDGVQIGATTATGELIVNDSSDDADGLGSQGDSGQYLKSAGAGVNPTWGAPTPVPTGAEIFTSDGTWDFSDAGSPSRVWVRIWGAGGGSDGEGATPDEGGGGGAYAEGPIAVTGDVTVQVGVGGTAGAAPNGAGGNGEDSTFAGSTTITAGGGTGGGAGGTASGDAFNVAGEAGAATYGGSSGGSVHMGSGQTAEATTAVAGAKYGGGGGPASGGGNAGAAGGDGLVIVYW